VHSIAFLFRLNPLTATGGAELSQEQRDAIDDAMRKQLQQLHSDFPYLERYGNRHKLVATK
jgi:hypothetical protein